MTHITVKNGYAQETRPIKTPGTRSSFWNSKLEWKRFKRWETFERKPLTNEKKRQYAKSLFYVIRQNFSSCASSEDTLRTFRNAIYQMKAGKSKFDR